MSVYSSYQYACDICGSLFDIYPHADGIVLNTGGFDLDGIMDICPYCAARLTQAMLNEIKSIRANVYDKRCTT